MDAKLLLAVLLALLAVSLASPAKLDDLARHGHGHDDDDDDDDERRPYSFAWEASRHYHGAPDREHREERGEDGITRGVFRYVDPSLRVQEVIYTADEDGFHVENTNDPEYTPAQVEARQRHDDLFRQIAEEHAKIGAERGDNREPYVEPLSYSGTGEPLDPSLLPVETEAVQRARARHEQLFRDITEQHARIAAERKTSPGELGQGGPYEYQYDTPLKTVEVVSGSLGPGVLSRSASVVAPGDNHPDFQGYGIPLATFRDDLTEEEALAILEEENERHFQQFRQEADLHESLVTMREVRPRETQSKFSSQSAGHSGSSRPATAGGRALQTHVSSQALNQQQSQKQFRSQATPQTGHHFRTDAHNQRSIGQSGTQSYRSINGGGHGLNQPSSGRKQQAASSGQAQYSAGYSGKGEITQTQHSASNQHGSAQFASPGTQGGSVSSVQSQHAQPFTGNQIPAGHSHQLSSQQQPTGTSGHPVSQSHSTSRVSKQGSDSRAVQSSVPVVPSGNLHAPNQPGSTFSTGAQVDQRAPGAPSSQYSAGAQRSQTGFASGQQASQGIFQTGSQGGQQTSQGRFQTGSQSGQQASHGTFQTGSQGGQQASQGTFQTGSQGGQQASQGTFQTGSQGGQQASQGRFQTGSQGGQQASQGRFQTGSQGGQQESQGRFQTGSQGGQQTGFEYNSADHADAAAAVAEQRREHLRQFQKISEDHERIGDEHVQLTLAALQKQRKMLEQW